MSFQLEPSEQLDQPVRSSRLGLLREPDFAKLWTAETISQFGTQVSLLAIPLVAISILQASAFEVALLGTIEFLPFLLFTLPAGAWVDRLPRRPILIVGDLGRAVSLTSIPIAYALGGLTIWQLYVVGFVNGVLTVFFDVAYQSYVPAIVDRDRLVEGNSKLEVSRAVAQISGPPVAGGLIGVITAPMAIIADALSFLGSAFFVFRIRRAEPPIARSGEGQTRRQRVSGFLTEVRGGLGYVLGNVYLRNIAASTASSNFFGNISGSIFLVYAVRELDMSAATIGVVFGLGSIGGLSAALLANRIARRIGLGPTIVLAIATGLPAGLLLALASPATAVVFLVVAAALNGFGGVVYNINQVSFRQAITPERMQGRMNATMRFIVWGTIPIGAVIGGIIATITTLHTAIWVGGIGAALPILPVLLSPVRSLRDMPAPANDETVAAPTNLPLGDQPMVRPDAG
ncbi:MAG TPA: MFS transporter [Candidatus Saccharimonadales bacterium]|nr:MFS transporter [Candidatus Saccharimonadales bacterium]